MSDKSLNFAKIIRNHVVDMCSRGGSSHVGSSLSIVDILSVLYLEVLKFDSNNDKLPNRDRFILSKGHAGSAVYATLAECGFFPVKDLENHYKNGSKLSGHISHKDIPGIEVSTGSLGHGLGIGAGIAYSARIQDKNFKTFVLLSDGELDEGSNWEALLFISHHKLNNLITIVDYNKLQSLGSVSSTLELEPIVNKFEAFGFEVFDIDGHNHQEIFNSLKNALDSSKPCLILCNTIKGKGVSFMENSVLWHYRSPQGEEYKLAKKELS